MILTVRSTVREDHVQMENIQRHHDPALEYLTNKDAKSMACCSLQGHEKGPTISSSKLKATLAVG